MWRILKYRLAWTECPKSLETLETGGQPNKRKHIPPNMVFFRLKGINSKHQTKENKQTKKPMAKGIKAYCANFDLSWARKLTIAVWGKASYDRRAFTWKLRRLHGGLGLASRASAICRARRSLCWEFRTNGRGLLGVGLLCSRGNCLLLLLLFFVEMSKNGSRLLFFLVWVGWWRFS